MQAENAGSAENPVVKIVLLSNNVDYWRRPSAEEEVQQRLTLAISGKASLSRYRWGNGTRHELIATRRLQFPPEQVSRLISEVYDAVVLRDSAIVACDMGCWIMTIHYENGESGSYWGSLIPDATRRLVILSETIRELLDCPDLFVFDGQARTDTLERLVLDYHRRTRSQPDVPPGHAPEIVTRDYAERLQIDRSARPSG